MGALPRTLEPDEIRLLQSLPLEWEQTTFAERTSLRLLQMLHNYCHLKDRMFVITATGRAALDAPNAE